MAYLAWVWTLLCAIAAFAVPQLGFGVPTHLPAGLMLSSLLAAPPLWRANGGVLAPIAPPGLWRALIAISLIGFAAAWGTPFGVDQFVRPIA